MGLLDSVIGAVGSLPSGGHSGGGSGGGSVDFVQAVIGLLGQQGGIGGLAGLVQKFQQAGLGEIVQSWIGTGANLPVSAEQLGQVLGPDTVASVAQQAGLGSGDMLGQLSQLLPQLVDKLTPDGQLPAGAGLGDLGQLGQLGQLGSLAGMLGGFMKR